MYFVRNSGAFLALSSALTSGQGSRSLISKINKMKRKYFNIIKRNIQFANIKKSYEIVILFQLTLRVLTNSDVDRMRERTLAGLAASARHHSALCYRTKTSDFYQKDFI